MEAVASGPERGPATGCPKSKEVCGSYVEQEVESEPDPIGTGEKSVINVKISILPSNLRPTRVFPEWMSDHCPFTSPVLEVGAGRGNLGEYPSLIKRYFPVVVGIDPSRAIYENPYCTERHQISIGDYARENFRRYDCIYSINVMEHVKEPIEFSSAIHNLLKPSGYYFGVTPNKKHYFGLTSSFLTKVNLHKPIVHILFGSNFAHKIDYKTYYRLNTVQKIIHCLEEAGFKSVIFKMSDNPVSFNAYFPKPLRFIPSLYSRWVYQHRKPEWMGTIMFCAQM